MFLLPKAFCKIIQIFLVLREAAVIFCIQHLLAIHIFHKSVSNHFYISRRFLFSQSFLLLNFSILKSISSIKEIYKIPELPQLEQEGFSFVGWYYDANFNTPAKKDDEIFADTTLYAKWEVSNVTVNIYSYISCVPEVMEVPYGQPIEVPGAPNREGYEFIGWQYEIGSLEDAQGEQFAGSFKIDETTEEPLLSFYVDKDFSAVLIDDSNLAVDGAIATTNVDIAAG